MPFLDQDSRGLMAVDGETRVEYGPVHPHTSTSSRQGWQQRRLRWALGATLLLAALCWLGSSLHRPSLANSAHAAISLSSADLAALDSRPLTAGSEVQKLIDAQKFAVPLMLERQGWKIDLGPYRALTYCTQAFAGTTYVVKVQIDDEKIIPKVAQAGEVLQLTVNQPIEGTGEPALMSAQVVAADDSNCISPLLPPPPALPHMVFDATRQVQSLCDQVKESVPTLLQVSGWQIDLAPYEAVSYCSDGLDFNVKVKVHAGKGMTTYKEGLYLQLLLRTEPVTALVSALMVVPLTHTCASMPVLPPLGKFVPPTIPALGQLGEQQQQFPPTTTHRLQASIATQTSKEGDKSTEEAKNQDTVATTHHPTKSSGLDKDIVSTTQHPARLSWFDKDALPATQEEAEGAQTQARRSLTLPNENRTARTLPKDADQHGHAQEEEPAEADRDLSEKDLQAVESPPAHRQRVSGEAPMGKMEKELRQAKRLARLMLEDGLDGVDVAEG